MPPGWHASEEDDPYHAHVYKGPADDPTTSCVLQRIRARWVPIWPVEPTKIEGVGRAFTDGAGVLRVIDVGDARLSCRRAQDDVAMDPEIDAILRSAVPDPEIPLRPHPSAGTKLADLCVPDRRHVMVLGRDGKLWWGAIEGTTLEPVAADPIVEIACGGEIVLARTQEGQLLSGTETMTAIEGAPRVTDLDVRAALTTDNRIFVVDPLAPTTGTVKPLPTVPPGTVRPSEVGSGGDLPPLTAIGGSSSITCAMDRTGWLWCWGEYSPAGREPLIFGATPTHVNDHTEERTYGPEPILRITEHPESVRGFAKRLYANPRLCVETEDELLCLGEGPIVDARPTCRADVCSCSVRSGTFECDDAPDVTYVARQPTERVAGVVAYDGMCAITERDEVRCVLPGRVTHALVPRE